MKIQKNFIFTTLFVSVQIFNLLVLLDLNAFYIRQIFGSIFLLMVPGLALLLALKIKSNDFWEALVFIVGLSVFFLMFTGGLTNYLLMAMGIPAPLATANYIWIFNLILIPILLLATHRNKKIIIQVKKPKVDLVNLVLVQTPLIFPFLAVSGAIRLNNNLSNPYTVTLLALVATWIVSAFLYRAKLQRGVYVFSLFLISVSFLLMTSLRGWYTTGHDNQLEFFVFQITSSDYTWNIADYRDPYNASLSITILPTVFKSLLGMSDIYIYKILFQTIFAFISVSLYLFFEKYTTKFIAFLSVVAFMSFPTFINDMPMLNRQEIAMFFFSLILILVFSRSIFRKNNKMLFFLFGFGMVVSHYSTTYIAIAQLFFVYFANIILSRIRLAKLNQLSIRKNWQRIDLRMILSLLALTLVWNVLLTNTTAGFSRVVTETYKNIGKTFSQDLKSGGVLYSLFNFSSLDKVDLLQNFKETSIEDARKRASKDRLFDQTLTQNYAISSAEEYKKPVTELGSVLASYSINPESLNFYMRQMVAKLVQLFMIVGSLIILFRKSKLVGNVDTEYLLLIFASFLTIAFFILLPVLSLEYGTQRLFQQSLMVSALPLVVGFISVFGIQISTALVTIMFLSLSGFIPYITGGYYPQLHLESKGSYYDFYMTHESEEQSLKWLKENYDSKYDIYSSPSARSRITAVSGMFSVRGLLPGVVTKDDYVYLGKANVMESIDVVSHKGDLMIHTVPLNFFNDNKNLIYNNTETKIYK